LGIAFCEEEAGFEEELVDGGAFQGLDELRELMQCAQGQLGEILDELADQLGGITVLPVKHELAGVPRLVNMAEQGTLLPQLRPIKEPIRKLAMPEQAVKELPEGFVGLQGKLV
jgi:hypothetical protein